MTQSFECPNCHAALEYDHTSQAVTVKCAYCSSTVIVPDSLRPQHSGSHFAPEEQAEILAEIVAMSRSGRKIEAIKHFREVFGVSLKEAKDVIDAMERQEGVWLGQSSMTVMGPGVQVIGGEAAAKTGRRVGCLVTVLILVIMAGVLIPIVISGGLAIFGISRAEEMFEDMPQSVVEVVAEVATAVPILPTETPAPSPTPAFADITLTIGGQEGIGPGFFNDTRRLGLDGEGNIYTGDYSGGRIQVFASDGSYVTQWNAGADLYMVAMTVSRSGIVYVAYTDQVQRFDGKTGAPLEPLPFRMRVEAMAAAPDGSVVLVAFDRLVRLDANGNVALDVSEPFADVADFETTRGDLFVDGAGNLYLVGSETIYKFDANGRFLTRIGSRGDGDDQFQSSPTSVAVDGQGRIYVDDIFGIKVLDANGRYLDTIPFNGVAFDMEMTSQNDLLVMDRNGNQVLAFRFNR